jgi:hypothetical protein
LKRAGCGRFAVIMRYLGAFALPIIASAPSWWIFRFCACLAASSHKKDNGRKYE